MLPLLPLPLAPSARAQRGTGGGQEEAAGGSSKSLATLHVTAFEAFPRKSITRHYAVVSVAEMAVAEYCFFLLEGLDVKKPGMAELWNDLLEDVDETMDILSAAGQGGELPLFPAPSLLSAFHELKPLVSTLLSSSKESLSAENAARAREFLTSYLQRRGIPTDTRPIGIQTIADSRISMTSITRIRNYGEYFSGRTPYAYSREFTKTVCASTALIEASGSFSTVVGAVMLNDEPKVYSKFWMFQDEEAGEKPQWRMEGIIACPFYTTAQQGTYGRGRGSGVGSALINEIGARIKDQKKVTTVAVSVAKSAPDFWREKLLATEFINCAGCETRKRMRDSEKEE